MEAVFQKGVELWLVAIDHFVLKLVETIGVARGDVDFVEGDSFDWEPGRERAFLGLGVAMGVDSHKHALGLADVDYNAGLHKGVNATLERFANV